MKILAYVGRLGPERRAQREHRDVDDRDDDRDALALVVGLRDRRPTC